MLKYESTLEKMLQSGKLKNAAKLASVLGITPQALSNYKRNGRMPAKLVFQFASLYNVSLDWLVEEEAKGCGAGTGKTEPPESEPCLSGVRPKEYHLTEEERVYVEKLLFILRSSNSTFKNVIKLGLDLEDRENGFF